MRRSNSFLLLENFFLRLRDRPIWIRACLQIILANAANIRQCNPLKSYPSFGFIGSNVDFIAIFFSKKELVWFLLRNKWPVRQIYQFNVEIFYEKIFRWPPRVEYFSLRLRIPKIIRLKKYDEYMILKSAFQAHFDSTWIIWLHSQYIRYILQFSLSNNLFIKRLKSWI